MRASKWRKTFLLFIYFFINIALSSRSQIGLFCYLCSCLSARHVQRSNCNRCRSVCQVFLVPVLTPQLYVLWYLYNFLVFPAIWVTWLIIVISKDQDGFSQACSSAQGCCFWSWCLGECWDNMGGSFSIGRPTSTPHSLLLTMCCFVSALLFSSLSKYVFHVN